MLKISFQPLLILIISIFALNANAALDARKEAEELVVLLNYDKQMNIELEKAIELQGRLRPEMSTFKEPMRAFFQQYMGYESLKPQLIELYVEAFTAEELNKLNAFYKSPIGKKAIKAIPEISEKGYEIAQSLLTAHAYELSQMLKEYAINNPNKISKNKSLQIIRKFHLSELLYNVAYNQSKSSQFYRTMKNKIGKENTERIINEELIKAAPEYQDWWNNQLALSIEEKIEQKKIYDLATNGKESIYAEEFDKQLPEIIMSILKKDGELMSKFTTQFMNAAFYERMQ